VSFANFFHFLQLAAIPPIRVAIPSGYAQRCGGPLKLAQIDLRSVGDQGAQVLVRSAIVADEQQAGWRPGLGPSRGPDVTLVTRPGNIAGARP
jgi:hypothetical protein